MTPKRWPASATLKRGSAGARPCAGGIAEKYWSEQIRSETKRKMQEAVEAELGMNIKP
jgi:hypothetical protein